MSDSFVEKLTLMVATVLWTRASKFDFLKKAGHRMATGCSKPRDREGGT
jgi:hypothetical protein